MSVVTFAEAMKVALQHHGAGRLVEAETVCRKILKAQPDYPDALHLIAIIAAQTGHTEAALDFFARATARDRDNGVLFIRYARTLRGAGRFDQAADMFRHAAALRPNDPDVWFGLGEVAREMGAWETAVTALEKARDLRPGHPKIWIRLARAHIGAGRIETGIEAARQALVLNPEDDEGRAVLDALAGTPEPAVSEPVMSDPVMGEPAIEPAPVPPPVEIPAPAAPAGLSPEERMVIARETVARHPDRAEAHLDLGRLLEAAGAFSEAAQFLRRALDLAPDSAQANRHLAQVLTVLRRLDEAAARYREAVAQAPDDIELRAAYGRLLLDLGRAEEAAQVFRAIETLTPGNARAQIDLGEALLALGRLEEAESRYRDALSREPGLVEAHANLGLVLHAQGRLAEAEASLRRALEIEPGRPAVLSSLLFCLNRKPDLPAAALADGHRRYGEAVGRPAAAIVPPGNRPEPERVLRVGYVSPDFRHHPVMGFFEPVLAAHDRSRVRAFCYAGVTRPDAVTARLRGRADGWRDVAGLPDAGLIDLIRADGIDILIDLAGHSAGNRLPVFAQRPAPVQLSWLGYANTTGLSAIDGFITDGVADPESDGGALFAEELVRLPGGFHCYLPPADAPEVAPLPAEAAGFITFGAFCPMAKITPAALALWARLLDRVPGARLALKSRPLAEDGARRRLLDLAAAHGIAAGRIEILDWAATPAGHLGQYGRIDVALDTFPCSGAATLCEALWMGVPVVTLRGDRHAGRIGASLLTQAGLPDLIAGNAEDYVVLAAELAANAERRAWLRARLRTRLRLSPLCDAKSVTRALETACREAWRRWCAASATTRSSRPPTLNDRAAPALTPLRP